MLPLFLGPFTCFAFCDVLCLKFKLLDPIDTGESDTEAVLVKAANKSDSMSLE